MDILDILVAKSLTPATQADVVIAKANQAIADANAAVATVEGLTSDIADLATTTENLNTTAQSTVDDLNAAIRTLEDAGFISALSFSLVPDTSLKKMQASVTVDDQTTLYDIVKYYTVLGNNEDGTVTQKLLNEKFNSVEGDISTLQGQVQDLIDHGGGGSTPVFPTTDSGRMVVIDDEGHLSASEATEDSIIKTNILLGTYTPDNALGVEIDYVNKSFLRLYKDPDTLLLRAFTGRQKCIVADNGTITAFHGDNEYVEDGSAGQVMVYQPKFYYLRLPTQKTGYVIDKEIIAIRDVKQAGFTLHPAFYDTNGNELEYCLLSTYEGSVYDISTHSYLMNDEAGVDFLNDKLCSIAGAKPASGIRNNLTFTNAERLAKNRGTGWHISTLATESVNQMIMLIESGTLNGQEFIEEGIGEIDNIAEVNCSSLTGSTASINTEIGAANETINERSGVTYTYNTPGKRAIYYRGVENPWGNMFKYIGNLLVKGDGTTAGDYYICKNYNYSAGNTDNYIKLSIPVPDESSWVSRFGYDPHYDYIFLPSVANNGANSSRPVGDFTWTQELLNGLRVVGIGGHFALGFYNGLFEYAMDNDTSYRGRAYGARLMFQPSKNAIHDANVELYEEHNQK